MAMTPATPHTCSTTRVTRADRETYATPTAVLTREPCLFAPWQPDTQTTTFGPAELNRWVLFIDYDADVKLGDEVTNDHTAEVFVVIAAPQKFDKPTTWEHDHQQVWLAHKASQ